MGDASTSVGSRYCPSRARCFNTEQVHPSLSPISAAAGYGLWLKAWPVFWMQCLGKPRHSIFPCSPTSKTTKSKEQGVIAFPFPAQDLSAHPHDPRSCCHIMASVRPRFSLTWIRSEAILKQDQGHCDELAFLNGSFPRLSLDEHENDF